MNPEDIQRDTSDALLEGLHHGREEVYLEYKGGDSSWQKLPKKLEIVQTIFALANERGGGLIIIGVEDNGTRIGLSEENYNSYSHDKLSQYLSGKGNQPVNCKLDKRELPDGKFVFIQVQESREFPIVYIWDSQRANADVPQSDIILRKGALYVRSNNPVGNKEIQTTQEWQEMIERTYNKYERETRRRGSIVTNHDPYEDELSI